MTAKRAGMVIVVVVVAVVLGVVWQKGFRERPQALADDSMETYFKYGSIGAEAGAGIPYWLWFILPKMFPDYLPTPGGWAALGFSWEPGQELPVGFSKKTIGYERVGINCALCHTARVRRPGQAVAELYAGGPAATVDILGYQRFLFACASDPRFTSSNILRALSQVVELSWLERLQYRFVLIPKTRKALLKQQAAFAWTKARPDWGRGRIDPFNPVKLSMLDVPVGDTIGNSDMQPIWRLAPKVQGKMAFHWDGLNTDFTEVILSSALGDGASRQSLPVDKLKALGDWLQTLKPPTFRDLFEVDAVLAQRGEAIFAEHCHRCHGGEHTGAVLPLTDAAWGEGIEGNPAGPLYTDPRRAQMWTEAAASAYNAYGDGEAWDFTHFRATGGYVNVSLEALWLRAPYLHNGSAPYLAELLELPEHRTKRFYRGHDVYDPERMGFVSEGPEAERLGSLHDTSQPGNSNQGHLWGTHLPDAEKRQLLEYLKTL